MIKNINKKKVFDKPGGVVAFWHVDDLKNTDEKLLGLGATDYDKITEIKDGFVTASVINPFSNILGIMKNPHYLKILTSLKK